MRNKMSGAELNEAIEAELRQMVREGYNVSPITNKTLHSRLKEKGVVAGSISTLTSRKEIIEHYKAMQLSEVRGIFGESARAGATKSRKELIQSNAALRKEGDECKSMLAKNICTLINLVLAIKEEGHHKNIERLLSPHLIRELQNHDKNK
ncbi:hypothetical protein [Aeromonas sobria]|uniref:hypothetical protein n=1 Tax=Aeromonas sobria TaxID=646 RepID=UPI00111821C1|nr:hypothetical protein [Aeromonas sobria]TNH92856.1 hypothetical protein CF137_18110 [Aeromonas sobria]